jgi:hypothetical protein
MTCPLVAPLAPLRRDHVGLFPRAVLWGPSPEGPQGHPAGEKSSSSSSELLDGLSSWAFAPGLAPVWAAPLRSPAASLVCSSLDLSRGPSQEVPPDCSPGGALLEVPPGFLMGSSSGFWSVMGGGVKGERTRRGRAWISTRGIEVSFLARVAAPGGGLHRRPSPSSRYPG